jgi:hypothetical protein
MHTTFESLQRQAFGAELIARDLPERSYAVLPGHPDQVIGIKRGELGYFPLTTNSTAPELNRLSEVSDAQALAMFHGSMYGWACLAAHPATWADEVKAFDLECLGGSARP